MACMCVRRSRHGMPSMRSAASRATISASVDECETCPCFLHIQVNGTIVRGPSIHKQAALVDFESSKPHAKLASEKRANLHADDQSPT